MVLAANSVSERPEIRFHQTTHHVIAKASPTETGSFVGPPDKRCQPVISLDLGYITYSPELG